MAKSTSPASAERPRRVDQALAEARAGHGRNRNQATEVPPSHKGSDLPNRGKGLKR